MSKLICAVLGASLGFAISAPLYAADAPRTEAWSDSQVQAAMDKCNALPVNERAKCVVNIRPAGGGGSSLATHVEDAKTHGEEAKTVKSGNETDLEFVAAIKQCDASKGTDKDRCIADVKDHYGRM